MLIILPSNTDPRHILRRRPPLHAYPSIADGKDPTAEDVLLLVNSALNSPFAKAAQAVIEAEPQYVRARLIELAALVAAEDETEAVAR